MTATIDPLGRTVTQQWCACGTLDALTDAKGNRTEWEWDVQGRVTKEKLESGKEWVYAYETNTSRLKDELGRLESRSVNGETVTYVYDALGRVFEEETSLGSFTYAYENVTSRLRLVTYPNSQTTSYAYHDNSEDRRLLEIHHRDPEGRRSRGSTMRMTTWGTFLLGRSRWGRTLRSRTRSSTTGRTSFVRRHGLTRRSRS